MDFQVPPVKKKKQKVPTSSLQWLRSGAWRCGARTAVVRTTHQDLWGHSVIAHIANYWSRQVTTYTYVGTEGRTIGQTNRPIYLLKCRLTEWRYISIMECMPGIYSLSTQVNSCEIKIDMSFFHAFSFSGSSSFFAMDTRRTLSDGKNKNTKGRCWWEQYLKFPKANSYAVGFCLLYTSPSPRD